MNNNQEICNSNENFRVLISNNNSIGSHNTLNNCIISNNCIVDSSYIINTSIGENAKILYSNLSGGTILKNATVGVYSHIREKSIIGENARIGNFVETKNCVIGTNSKSAHLTYLGDCELGNNVNVGCGTIFCNYNGKIKQKSFVGDNVFIGSNSNIVAPVNIGNNSFIAAGSTITKNVPNNALAIARAYQVNKENYIN